MFYLRIFRENITKKITKNPYKSVTYNYNFYLLDY